MQRVNPRVRVVWSAGPGGPDVPSDLQGVAEELEPWLRADAFDGDGCLVWACLPAQGLYWVGCTLAKGALPDRGKVFIACGWAAEDDGETFDPGAVIGDPVGLALETVPETPDRGGSQPTELDHGPGALGYVLLTYLLDGMVRGRPLVVIAAPELLLRPKGRASLLSAVAFARAALPARLRRRCKMRLPSLNPEVLLGPDGADLLAVPTELASKVLGVRRDAAILDLRGNCQSGVEPDPSARAYARAVAEAAARFPHGLAAFGARFDRLWDGALPLGADLIDAIPTVYNLGVALHGSLQQRGDLFANHLIARARTTRLPWDRLVCGDEWLTFPEAPLGSFLLRQRGGMTPGELDLSGAVAAALSRSGRHLDQAVLQWWDQEDPVKRARLLDLARAASQPLVSAGLVAELCGGIPLRDLLADGPIAGVLAAELGAGTLGQRASELPVIASQADDPQVAQVLCDAAREGVFDPSWVEALIEWGGPGALVGVLLTLLSRSADLDALGDVVRRLLGASRPLGCDLANYAPSIAAAAEALDPARRLRIYLGLMDALRAADPGSVPRLMGRFWSALKDVADPASRRQAAAELLGGGWTCVSVRDLVDDRGGLRPGWLGTLPDLILAHEGLMRIMALPTLLALRRQPGADPALWSRAVTVHWRHNPRAATEALIRADAWPTWRRQAELGPGELRQSSLLWLTAVAWVHHRNAGHEGLPPHWHLRRGRNPYQRPPECTWDAWRLAMAGLIGGLTAQDLATISAPQAHWPWIYSRESEQVDDLTGLYPTAASR